jgi:ribosome-associated toxin RatA of RatAB toxin-antitoxin module
MSTVEKSIEVNVPVRTAYDQWSQFEEFPRFMEGVEEVRQLDDKRLHWRAQIAGKQEEWDAEIIEQVPDQRIVWRSTSGAQNDGTVTFEPIDANRTRVMLRLDYHPQSFMEKAGDALGFVSTRVEGNLKRFKEFIESRGVETGAWRGEIHGAEVEPGTSAGLGSGIAGGAAAGLAGVTDYDTITDQSLVGGAPGSDAGATTDYDLTNRDFATASTTGDLYGGGYGGRPAEGGTVTGRGTTGTDIGGGGRSGGGGATGGGLSSDIGAGAPTERDLVGGTTTDRDIGAGATGGDVGADMATDRGLYAGTTDIGAGTTGGSAAGGGTPNHEQLQDLISERELPGDPTRARSGAGKEEDQDLAGGSTTGGGAGTSSMGIDVDKSKYFSYPTIK